MRVGVMNEWLDPLSRNSLWETLQGPEVVIALLCLIALAGVVSALPFPRRKRGRRRAWSPRVIDRRRNRRLKSRCRTRNDRMEVIARVAFEPQPLLNKSEYQVLILLEAVVAIYRRAFASWPRPASGRS